MQSSRKMHGSPPNPGEFLVKQKACNETVEYNTDLPRPTIGELPRRLWVMPHRFFFLTGAGGNSAIDSSRSSRNLHERSRPKKYASP